MATKASENEVCQSVLDFVTEGSYPSSEGVAASDFPVSALSKELELISRAREQVEVSCVLFTPCSSHAVLAFGMWANLLYTGGGRQK